MNVNYLIEKGKGRKYIKLSIRINPEVSNEELLFARQLGVDCVYTWVKENQLDYKFLNNLRKKVNEQGLELYNVGNFDLGKSPEIHLALPGREEKIDRFKSFIKNLGKAEINTTTFTWEPAGVWSSGKKEIRGAGTRYVDQKELEKRSLIFEREYTRKELWDNFRYFIKEIIPVAEKADVRLALHPNDPPVPSLGGVPCLIHNFNHYKKAFEIAESDNLGMEFCVGCWLEGGDKFGNIFRAIKYFGQKSKIFIVHFRNVSSPLPEFKETFLDNGYMDMERIIKQLKDINYQGTITPDHVPAMVGGKKAGTAYSIGYMKALLKRS
ncbi:MAG: mannonate dehydratase [Halanaerobiales bacterium]